MTTQPLSVEIRLSGIFDCKCVHLGLSEEVDLSCNQQRPSSNRCWESFTSSRCHAYQPFQISAHTPELVHAPLTYYIAWPSTKCSGESAP